MHEMIEVGDQPSSVRSISTTSKAVERALFAVDEFFLPRRLHGSPVPYRIEGSAKALKAIQLGVLPEIKYVGPGDAVSVMLIDRGCELRLVLNPTTVSRPESLSVKVRVEEQDEDPQEIIDMAIELSVSDSATLLHLLMLNHPPSSITRRIPFRPSP